MMSKHRWRRAHMEYTNLSYDYIATFFLFMLLIWYITEKKVPLKSFKFFFYVISFAFMASFLETVGYIIVRYSDRFSIRAAYITTSFQMLFIHSFILMITYCLLNMVHVDLRSSKAIRATFAVSGILISVLTLPNIFIKGWSFDLPNGKYTAVGIGNLLYLIDLVMVVFCLWVFIKRGRDLKFIKPSISVFLIIVSVGCGIAQLLLFAPMLNMAIATLCMVMYLYQQSPDAYTDEITGQFNRALFGEYVQEKFLDKKPFSVIVTDLVDFRQVNQSFGAACGDALLFAVGGHLDKISQHCAVFRFDADQFCIVVNGDESEAFTLAESIQERFTHSWQAVGQELMMKATVCIIECPSNAKSYNELLEVISYSMESAKLIKKGSVNLARELDLKRIHEIRQIENAVKAAINDGSVRVYYQPLYSTRCKCYNAAEALARIRNEALGDIPPDMFIPIAERSGMINELGDIILEKVCRFIRDSELDKTQIKYIDVNVSPVQLMQHDYARRVLEILKKYEVSPKQINIEITETAMMNTFPVVSENIRALISSGIMLSLDDYGTGYANISYINRMPFQYIKLDKELVWEAFKNEKARITLEHTVRMLNALELCIVAEGIETEEMCAALTEFGCTYLQGWYFSKAVPPETFTEMISRSPAL